MNATENSKNILRQEIAAVRARISEASRAEYEAKKMLRNIRQRLDAYRGQLNELRHQLKP
jgi:chromosome segregation ATPase